MCETMAGECGAAPTKTGGVPTAPAPGCSCQHLEEDWALPRTFAGDVLMVCWGGGREDTSSAEHGEGQDIAPQSVPAVNALVLDIEPSGLPSPELKTCGL